MISLDRLRDSCIQCMTKFKNAINQSPHSMREKSALEVELFTLLQFLTIEKQIPIEEATPSDISEWLKPAYGFSDYGTRIEMLKVISVFLPNIQVPTSVSPARISWWQVKDFLFWASKHRRLRKKTWAFYESITQEQILDSELRCSPFYQALHTVFPGRDDTGGFSESDEEIVKILEELGHAMPPEITDLGCGGGRLLRRLRQEFPTARLNGTSIFKFGEAELKSLKEIGVNAIYSTANFTGIPANSQDIVVSTMVIEHLRHPEDMVDEIHRILKPGGIFVVTAPSVAANLYCKNPFSYVVALFAPIFPWITPPFHQLYSPLTPIRIVHHAFSPHDFNRLFSRRFHRPWISTHGFIALKKFGLSRLAPRLPLVREMGGVVVAAGRKSV